MERSFARKRYTGITDLRCSDALVQSTVIGVDARDVQMRHDVTVDRDVLAHLQSLGVRQAFSIEFPGDFGSGISAGDTVQKHARSGLKSLLGEGLTNLRRLDCR